MSETELPGDPQCICQGTGLLCALALGGSPDPETIEVCECVARTAARRARDEVRIALEPIVDHSDWPVVEVTLDRLDDSDAQT